MTIRILSTIALAAAVSGVAACSNASTAPTALATNSSATDSASGAAGAASNGQSSSARIRLIAILTPPTSGTFRRASGKAHHDSRNNNTKRELEMEVEDVTPGQQLDFFVNGVKYGATTTVDALGNASINVSTQLGQKVPTAAAGLTAEVRAVGGAVVVTGIFPKS